MSKNRVYRHLAWCPDSESNQGHRDFQSPALPTELSGRMERKTRFELATLALARRCSTTEPLPHKYEIKKWRSGTGSNRRPPAWQAGILTNWTTGPHALKLRLIQKDFPLTFIPAIKKFCRKPPLEFAEKPVIRLIQTVSDKLWWAL